GKRTLIMGVVNVTPDSFSDGGLHLDPEAAVAHALQLVADGADIIDIGGESTRPGASVIASAEASASSSSAKKVAVSEREELDRVIPVITSLRRKRSEVVISVDTYKAAVARAAVEAGAEIVNHEENYPLLKRFAEFHDLRYPLMAGVSRKSFIGRALARDGKDAGIPDRLYGTLAAETAAILKGAHVIRTHDVKACADAVRIADIVVS